MRPPTPPTTTPRHPGEGVGAIALVVEHAHSRNQRSARAYGAGPTCLPAGQSATGTIGRPANPRSCERRQQLRPRSRGDMAQGTSPGAPGGDLSVETPSEGGPWSLWTAPGTAQEQARPPSRPQPSQGSTRARGPWTGRSSPPTAALARLGRRLGPAEEVCPGVDRAGDGGPSDGPTSLCRSLSMEPDPPEGPRAAAGTVRAFRGSPERAVTVARRYRPLRGITPEPGPGCSVGSPGGRYSPP